jgi:hypothetical protein
MLVPGRDHQGESRVLDLDRNQTIGLLILLVFIAVTLLWGLLGVMQVIDCCPPDLSRPGAG